VISGAFNNKSVHFVGVIIVGYLILDYRGDLDDKLQTYNEISDIIWRHFGKQLKRPRNLVVKPEC
jgi:hypothetical protein